MAGRKQSDEYLWNRAFNRFQSRFVIDVSTGCWNWAAGKSKRTEKYIKGIFTMPREHSGRPASQCSWIFNKGPIPIGKHILHTCDNSLCVNPEHLYLGDHIQNMKDKKERKRSWNDLEPERCRTILVSVASHPGESNGSAKLTWEKVREIRSSELKAVPLAKKYGVHKTLIYQIRKNKIWKEFRCA